MSNLKTVKEIKAFVKAQTTAVLCGQELNFLGINMHDPSRFHPYTGLTRDEYGMLRCKMMAKYLPMKPRNKEFPEIKEVNVIDQLIMSAYFVCKGGHILHLDLADKLGCSLPKAGLLLIFSINALYHVVKDGLNKDLTVGEIVQLQGIFKDLFGSTALTLIADFTLLNLKIGNIAKSLLVVCTGNLIIRFVQLIDWCSDSKDDEEFLNSKFYKEQLSKDILKSLKFKCSNAECNHGDMEVEIPWIVCVDAMMDFKGMVYKCTKNVWPPLVKTCANYKGQVTGTAQAFNEAWEEIRSGIELEPISQIKKYEFFNKIVPENKFSHEFIDRIVDLIMLMENIHRNGFFEDGPEGENPPASLPSPNVSAHSGNEMDPRRSYYKCVLPLKGYNESKTPKPTYANRLSGLDSVGEHRLANLADIVPPIDVPGSQSLPDRQIAVDRMKALIKKM